MQEGEEEMLKKMLLISVFVSGLLLMAAPTMADQIIDYAGPASLGYLYFNSYAGSNYGIAGSEFHISTTISINALGIYDAGNYTGVYDQANNYSGHAEDGDGLLQNHDIGLYKINGTLVAKATINAGGGTLLNGYRWVNLTNAVTIGPGDYVVAATYIPADIFAADDFRENAPINNPFTWVNARYGVSTNGLVLPTIVVAPYSNGYDGFYGPNVAVPEPSILLLIGFGFVGLAAFRKRSQKA
jgi:hypothetical protein